MQKLIDCGKREGELKGKRDTLLRLLIAIPVGAFADPAFPGPTFSVHEERMHGWVVMPQDIEPMR